MKNWNSARKYKKNNNIYLSKNKTSIFVNNSKLNGLILDSLSSKKKTIKFKKKFPNYWDMIFSYKRNPILELLHINKNDICIDYGSMWGVHTIEMAKRSKAVFSIDQTLSSLQIIKKRALNENLNNIVLIKDDLKKIYFNNHFTKALVNGVLEWIPEINNVILSEDYGKFKKKKVSQNPKVMQLDFLKKVHKSLKHNGVICLAIENRFDYKHFLGSKDPHNNLRFTTLLPRFLSNVVSNLLLGRNYVNYTYSFQEIKKILKEAKFKDIETYAVFPHYHKPELILNYNFFHFYKRYWDWNAVTFKSSVRLFIEYVMMKYLKLKFFSPSIIVTGKK